MARRHKASEEETSYWLSYSDMMAALLLMFVLIISLTIMQAKRRYEEKEKELAENQKQIEEQKEQIKNQQEQLDKIIGVKSDLIVDSHVLFDSAEYKIKSSGADFLDAFLPRYFHVLMDEGFREYISEIIIEGHTDSNSSYMYNLELSQQRALSVAKYCLDEETSTLSQAEIEELKKILTANGRSFSNPVLDENGNEDMAASRRVEFKFRLKDEEMVEEMIKILDGEG